MPSASQETSDSPAYLSIARYQARASATDQTVQKGLDSLDFPLLGLFGEVGSLLSELKKKQRDTDSYSGYATSVLEEFGDVLWYFSNLATRAHIPLSDLASQVYRANTSGQDLSGKAHHIDFAALQPHLNATAPTSQEAFENTLMCLAGEVGKLVADFSAGCINANQSQLVNYMSAIFRALINAANAANISLADAAQRNLAKIFDRWPETRTHPPLFDEQDNPAEQLPRRIEMHIFEKTVSDRTYVFLRCNGINIGDRLTDNKLEKDNYRFHDVFHLAYAAILGWSPVMRALFRVKRKSRPEVDEAEDGARAILIEEGISTWVFNHATRLNYFENLDSLEYGLLKDVRQLVTGYEAERCPLWLWEDAILNGYAVFRELCEHRAGIVVANLTQRTITFQKLK